MNGSLGLQEKGRQPTPSVLSGRRGRCVFNGDEAQGVCTWQEGRFLSLGLSAGPGAVQFRGGVDNWTIGPHQGVRFVEIGWKGIQNVRGLRANVWSLQLVRRWRL